MNMGPPGAVHFHVNKNADTPGVWQRGQPKNEQRKFGYKTRKLRHPLRQTDEQEALIQMEAAKEEDKKKFNKNNTDFIRKNKEWFKSRDHTQPPPPGNTRIKPGTVTLTQEQLAALLASLGKTDLRDNPLKISIDVSNNKVEVKELDSPDSREKAKNEKYKNGREFNGGDESDSEISALLERVDKPGKATDSGIRLSEENRKITRGELNLQNSHARSNQGKLTPEVLEQEPRQEAKREAELGNVPDIVSWKHLTVGERKRLQWARERAELQDVYDPWGKPGAGAPRQKQNDKMTNATSGESELNSLQPQNVSWSDTDAVRKKKQELIMNEIEKLEKEIRDTEQRTLEEEDNLERIFKKSEKQKERERTFQNPNENRTETSERKDKMQKMTEVQMKAGSKTWSSLQDDSQGIMGLESTASQSRKESDRKKWVAELDKQREEQRLRKQQEKDRDREGIHDQFVDRFVYHKSAEHTSPSLVQHVTHNTSKETNNMAFPIKRTPENVPDSSRPPATGGSGIVGGAGILGDAGHNNTKTEEKRRWLEQLDQQREEQRLARLAQREKDRQDAGIWADRYPADHQKLLQMNEILQQQPVSPREDPASSKRTNSAPLAGSVETEKSSTPPATFLRGQGAFIDPVTRREQAEKRRIQLEYQAQVKAQIEEKERRKKEEQEKKIREDMEEERKLQIEREALNRQLEMEQMKSREREEQRQKQIAVLKSAMDEAREKAAEEKNVKRIQHLQQRGHDVSQLKTTYDVGTLRTEVDLARFDWEPPTELGSSELTRTKDAYTVDHILTPTSYRNPSKSSDVSDSARKEFGTQTLELKDLQAILQNLPDEVQIEYKMKVEEALQEKEKRKQAPSRKVHVKNTEDVNKNAKAAKPREKPLRLEERPQWNQRKRKTVTKNSEKDPFYWQKKEEADLRKERREKQLFYLQELNKEKIPSHSRSPGRYRDESPEGVKRSEKRDGKEAANGKERDRKPRAGNKNDDSPNILSLLSHDENKSAGRSSPPVPTVRHRTTAKHEPDRDPYIYANNLLQINQADSKYGDAAVVHSGEEFMPFMRTTEILDPSRADEPMAISRENTRMEKARHSYYETHHPANKGRKLDVYQDREREAIQKASQNPLLNPGLVSTHPTYRQEMILQQLSSLKQTLKQKQKELEGYMSPHELPEGVARG